MRFYKQLALCVFVIGGSSLALYCVPSSAADERLTIREEPRPSNIRLQATERGLVFADSRGMTLYYGLHDPRPGISTCTAEVVSKMEGSAGDIFYFPNAPNRASCRDKLLPAQVGTAQPIGGWTIIDRPDGIKQWAHKGRAVYGSVKDRVPGDANAASAFESVSNTLEVAFVPLDTPAEIKVQQVGVARVLATLDGLTLYMSKLDSSGKSICEGACAETWPPLLGGMLSQARGEWTLVVRADMSRQWAFHGRPLYTYVGDTEVGDINGNGLRNAEVALAYPIPQPPKSVTTHATAIGPVYADSKGMTLYMFTCSTDEPLSCDDPQDKSLWWTSTCGNETTCADIWRPLLAPKNARAAGHDWSIVTMSLPWSPVRAADSDQSPGVKVWAYRSRPVFTYKFEDLPGMIDGKDIGVVRAIRWVPISAVGSDVNQPKENARQRKR